MDNKGILENCLQSKGTVSVFDEKNVQNMEAKVSFYFPQSLVSSSENRNHSDEKRTAGYAVSHINSTVKNIQTKMRKINSVVTLASTLTNIL